MARSQLTPVAATDAIHGLSNAKGHLGALAIPINFLRANMNADQLLDQIRERASDSKRATYMREECSDMYSQRALARSPVAAKLRMAAVAQAEKRLGFALPEFLRRLYTEVGNGGFGPGYGIYGLDAATGDEDDYLIDRYETDKDIPQDEFPGTRWPTGLVAICHWGCGEYSYVNCNTRSGTIYRFDIEMYDPQQPSTAFRRLSDPHFSRECPSLKRWLEQWLSGELDED